MWLWPFWVSTQVGLADPSCLVLLQSLLPSRRAAERVFDLRLRPGLVALNLRACPDLLLPLTASPDPLPSHSWKFSVWFQDEAVQRSSNYIKIPHFRLSWLSLAIPSTVGWLRGWCFVLPARGEPCSWATASGVPGSTLIRGCESRPWVTQIVYAFRFLTVFLVIRWSLIGFARGGGLSWFVLFLRAFLDQSDFAQLLVTLSLARGVGAGEGL